MKSILVQKAAGIVSTTQGKECIQRLRTQLQYELFLMAETPFNIPLNFKFRVGWLNVSSNKYPLIIIITPTKKQFTDVKNCYYMRIKK